MIHNFLFTIICCFEQKDFLNDVCRDIEKRFSRRGILIQTVPVHQPHELAALAAQNILPDMLVFSGFSNASANDLFHNILCLKEKNPSMISVSSSSVSKAYHFLLEPFFFAKDFSMQELWSCVCKAYDLSCCRHDTFSYYHRPAYEYVALKDILYFTSELRCIRLVTKDNSNSFYGRLDDIEESLHQKSCRFVRIHQSYLVNTAFISSYSRRFVTLLTGEKLRISTPDYYRAVRASAEGQ